MEIKKKGFNDEQSQGIMFNCLRSIMELIMYVSKAPLADVRNLLSHPGLSA